MTNLLSTTALVVALAVPTLTLAQTTQSATDTASGMAGTQSGTALPGFLVTRGPSDLFASDLIGHAVHARRTPTTATGGTATMAGEGTREMAVMNRADLDDMDNIGQINEIVLSSDGQVRAIVIGVGGFLGIGQRDVAVTLDQVTFAADPDDRTGMFVIVNTGADELKTSPAFDRSMATDRMEGSAEARTGGSPFAAPEVARDGYDRVAMTEVSSEMLVGKSVYGLNDKSVGTIDDLILDDKGAVTDVIIDFGGFLGMGTSQVSVAFDGLTVLTKEGGSDVRVYVDATKEQIQAQPKYRAVN